MNLLEYKDFQVNVSPEALLVGPIRKLYNKDRTVNKDKFMQQLSVIFFMADPRSNYNYIIDESDRLKAIAEQEGLPDNYTISSEVKEAIDVYKKLCQTTSTLLLEDTRAAVDKVRKFLRDVDLELLDEKGKPVYTINSITSALKQIPQLAKDLQETEKLVTKEIEEAGRMRGGNTKKSIMD